MTILDNGTRNQYTATASQTVFQYTFEIFITGDIKVEQNGAVITAYTVSNVGNNNGGNITLTTGATSGDIITIYRDMDLDRLTDYPQNGDFLASDVNNDFDRVWSGLQQNQEGSNLAIRVAVSDAILNSSNTVLAAPSVRGGKILGFTSSGELDYISAAIASGDFTDVSTTTAMKVLLGISVVSVVQTKEFSTGEGGGGVYDTIAGTGTANTRDRIAHASLDFTFVLRGITPINSNAFSLAGDATLGIQAALDSLSSGQNGGSVVILEHNRNYIISGVGIQIGPNQTLDCNSAKVTYTGTGTAFTLGNSDTVLSFYPKLLNLNLRLQDKTSLAVLLRVTANAKVEGFVEGLYQPFDNTRTNLGLHIDARNGNSFFNEISLRCHHMHDGFKIESTGSIQSTAQYFYNCQHFGDQATDDSGTSFSIGDGSGPSSEGIGTTISGGYLEKVNTMFKLGADAGNITFDGVMTEIIKGGSAWIFDFVDGCRPCTIKGVQGLGTSYMESNSGIRNWDSNPGHMLLSDDQGSIRLGGFAGPRNNTKFIGLGGTNPFFLRDENSTFLMITETGGATDTGRTFIQQGQGSLSHGPFLELNGEGAASKAGECHIGCSAGSTGDFFVDRGFGGTNLLRIARNQTFVRPGVNNIAKLGEAAFLWTEVFATNATINTSDARLKTELKPLSKDELNAGKEILKAIGGWQWLAKVEKEGEDARIHYGPTVQAVMKILEDNNIKPFSLSFVCFDEWEDEYKKVDLNEDKVDEEGKPLAPDIIEELIRESGDVYSLRKNELIMFLLAGISARMEAAGI